MSRGTDARRMRACLALAERGAGAVSPNPMVGAIVVRNGRVVGKGWHRAFGGPHAEAGALRAAGQRARGATLYVNLEPCAHWGKTPPCTARIIAAGIRRVVVGMIDPNPRVRGRGVRALRAAGIVVAAGVEEEACRLLNEEFITYIRTGRPFVTVKLAVSLDGRIALRRGEPRRISNARSRALVHAMRARADAVLVGAGTVIADDPRLNVRAARGASPLRVVVDGRFRVPERARLFRGGGRAIVYTTPAAEARHPAKAARLRARGIGVVSIPPRSGGKIPAAAILRHLGGLGVASLLVEGGAATAEAFRGAAGRLVVITAPVIFGRGLAGFRRAWNLRGAALVMLSDNVVARGRLVST